MKLSLITLILLSFSTIAAEVRQEVIDTFENCTGYKFMKDYKFSKYTPKEKSFSKVTLPHDKNYLFRSTSKNSQFPIAKMVRAMLGDQSAFVGNKGVWKMSDYLLKKSNSTQYIHEKLVKKVTKFRDCLNETKLTAYEAYRISIQFYNNYWKWAEDNGKIPRNLNYDIAGNGPGQIIFSTAYPTAADCYGSTQVMISDKRDRAIDLGFYNYKLHRGWHNASKQYPDNAEHITPAAYYPDEIQAYYQKTGSDSWLQWNVEREVVYALFKVETKDERLIAIVNGNNIDCIIPHENNIHRCKYNYSKGKVAPHMEDKPFDITDEVLPIAGVLKLCKSKDDPECRKSSWFASQEKDKINAFKTLKSDGDRIFVDDEDNDDDVVNLKDTEGDDFYIHLIQ